jgi:carbon storage regulator CsrA
MLVLTRKATEKILIGDNVALSIVQIQGNKVRIGVEAPPHVTVMRSELVGREPRQSSGKLRNILIVDDSPEDRSTFRRFLDAGTREPRYSFAEASCGREGLDLFRVQHPDCVLLDFRMPDLDGLEFLAEMKSGKLGNHVPVIMLTGQGAEAVAVQAMKSGAVDYLVKQHVTKETLQRTVYQALTGSAPGSLLN